MSQPTRFELTPTRETREQNYQFRLNLETDSEGRYSAVTAPISHSATGSDSKPKSFEYGSPLIQALSQESKKLLPKNVANTEIDNIETSRLGSLNELESLAEPKYKSMYMKDEARVRSIKHPYDPDSSDDDMEIFSPSKIPQARKSMGSFFSLRRLDSPKRGSMANLDQHFFIGDLSSGYITKQDDHQRLKLKRKVMIQETLGVHEHEKHKIIKSKLSKLIFLKEPIAPDDKFRVFWDIFSMVLIFYQMITVPFKIAFNIEDDAALTTINFFMDAFFYADVILNFNTGFYEKGLLIMDRKSIIKNYMGGWFWLDIISSLPYDSIIDTNSGAGYDTRIFNLLRFFKFMRILRLLRVLKLSRIFMILDAYFDLGATFTAIVGLIKMSIIIFLTSHWIGCLWFFIADANNDNEVKTWASRRGIMNLGLEEQYIASVYWGVTTMVTVGYGDFIPITLTEKILAIFTMLIARTMLAFTANRIDYIVLGFETSTVAQQ